MNMYFHMFQMFLQPVHEALDSKFLKVEEGTYSRENLKRRFLLRAILFTGNTLVTAAIPFMGDFMNFLGSFTLVTLTFIFPSVIFIKVNLFRSNQLDEGRVFDGPGLHFELLYGLFLEGLCKGRA